MTVKTLINPDIGGSVTVKRKTSAAAASDMAVFDGATGTLKIDSITNLLGTGGPTFPQGIPGLAATWTPKSAAYTLISGDRIAADSTAAPFTLTLPASPAVGTPVEVSDAGGTWAVNNVTLDRNGSSIESSATDLILDVSKARLLLVFVGGSIGWKVYD